MIGMLYAAGHPVGGGFTTHFTLSIYTNGTYTKTIQAYLFPYRYAEWSNSGIDRRISYVGIRNRKVC